MKRRQERWVLLALMAVMATLQIGLAARQSLWADEIFSLAIATGHSLEHPAAAARLDLGDFVEPERPIPAEDFRRYLQHDVPPASPARVIRAVFLSDTSPPLYYLLLYGWTLIFGTGDLVLRLFSIGWSLASLPLIAAIARRTCGRWASLPSCVLFVFSPLAIYYSTEGRMYSLLLFLILATVWVSLVLRQRGGDAGLYALWIVASAAGFLTHYFFLFPWIAVVAFLVMRPGRFDRRWLVICAFLTAVVILSWYWMAPDSMSRWRVTEGWLKWRPDGFNRWRALLIQFLQFFSGAAPSLWASPRWAARTALALFAMIFGWMAWRQRGKIFSRGRLLLWLWLIAACAAPSALDYLQHTYTANVPRYALAAMPAAYLLPAFGLTCVGARTRLILLVVIVLAWSPSLRRIYRGHSRDQQPVREVARGLDANAGSSDLIVVHSIPSGVLGVARYTHGAAPIASWVQQLGTRRVPESLQSLATGRERVFLVKVHTVGAPAPEEDWLRANAEVSEDTRRQGIQVVTFRAKNAATF